jgi:hypothetical protein
MPNSKRNRLVHSYFDAAIGKHQLFIYNKEKVLITHLMISTTGEIQVYKGKIIEV